MKELSNDILIKLASEIASIEKEEREKLPYNANIIDDIRILENAHSRILATLLKYAGYDKSYPVYHEFIELLKRKCCAIRSIKINNPKITVNKEFIDILIDESPMYSIIIENKVHWADDQPEQIERYIDIVKAKKTGEKNIFVIYLTKDGSKKVTDKSLTQKAKGILDYDDKKLCRFIELNYKNDLLPMFVSLVNKIDRDKEPLLHSSLVQYVDYWNGRFCMREADKKILQKTAKYMAEELNISSVQDCLKIQDELPLFQKTLNEKQCELMKQVLNEKVISSLKKCYGGDYEFIYMEEIKVAAIKIIPQSWNNSYIYLGASNDDCIIIGVYGNNISKVAAKLLKAKDYKEDSWKGYNKYVIKKYFYSLDFWELVDNGSFLKEAKKYVKEILIALEGKKL
jgi:hypothetical protein